MYIIPAIEIGADYKDIYELTPFSLAIIVKGLVKRNKLYQKQQDMLNYMSATYVLAGLGGKLPKKPYLENIDVEETSSEEKHYEAKKARFITIMSSINQNFRGKEENTNG